MRAAAPFKVRLLAAPCAKEYLLGLGPMQRLLARTLELGFGACGWREPGMEGESMPIARRIWPAPVW